MVLRDTIPPSTAFVAAFWSFGGLFLGGIFKGGFRETQLSLRGGTFVAKVPKTGGISGYPPKPPSTVGG